MDVAHFDELQTLRDLSRPEHLLVWALRVIVLGHGDCPALSHTFERACGPLGEQALVTYHAIVKIIAMAGRRRLQVHVPGCACVSADEKAIVDMVAVAQASLNGDEAGLRAHLETLLGCEPPQTLVMAAQAVARILGAEGGSLPRRSLENITPAPPQARPTLH